MHINNQARVKMQIPIQQRRQSPRFRISKKHPGDTGLQSTAEHFKIQLLSVFMILILKIQTLPLAYNMVGSGAHLVVRHFHNVRHNHPNKCMSIVIENFKKEYKITG